MTTLTTQPSLPSQREQAVELFSNFLHRLTSDHHAGTKILRYLDGVIWQRLFMQQKERAPHYYKPK
jgi:hypothetical protein